MQGPYSCRAITIQASVDPRLLSWFRIVLSCSILSCTAAAVRWLAYFASLGPLITMIVKMVQKDLIPFAVVCLYITVGFALALSTALFGNETDQVLALSRNCRRHAHCAGIGVLSF